MDAEKSRIEPLPTRARLIALAAVACVLGGVVCLAVSPQPDAFPFRIGFGVLLFGVVLAAVGTVLEARRAPHLYTQSAKHLFENLTVWHLPVTGVDWAGIDLAYAKHVKRMIWMGYALPAVALVLLLAAIFYLPAVSNAGDPSRWTFFSVLMALFFILAVASAIGSHRRLGRNLRRRLGADPTHLLYDPGTGEIQRHEWSTVLTDKSQLLIGRHLMLLVAPSGLVQTTIYQQDALRGLVLARLPPSSFVGAFRLRWKAFTRGNAELGIMVSLLGAVLAWQAFSMICPECLSALRGIVREWVLEMNGK
jgi:hypothetical protein